MSQAARLVVYRKMYNKLEHKRKIKCYDGTMGMCILADFICYGDYTHYTDVLEKFFPELAFYKPEDSLGYWFSTDHAGLLERMRLLRKVIRDTELKIILKRR